MSFEINPFTGKADGIGVPQVKVARAPTSADYKFPQGQQWVDTAGGEIYFLASVSGTTATWEAMASGGAVITQIDGDSGSATPTGGVITLATGTGASSSASGDTVTFSLDASLVDIVGLAKTDGNFIVGDGANWVAESGATARTSLGLGTAAVEDDTKYCSRADNLANLANAATARTNLGLGTIATQAANNVAITGGSITGITDLAVADGGTGVSSNTAYAVLCGGTTGAGAIQSIASVGTSGQVLTSNGAGALPTFQAAGGGYDINLPANSNLDVTSSGEFLLNSRVSGADNTDTLTSNALWLTAFCIGREVTSSTVGVNVSSGASTNFRFAIYTDSNGQPGTRIMESGNIDASSTGYKFATCSYTFSPGIYWFAISRESTNIALVADSYRNGMGYATSTNSMNQWITLTGWSYGEIPSTFTWGNYTWTYDTGTAFTSVFFEL